MPVGKGNKEVQKQLLLEQITQLKVEAAIKRVPVSRAATDLVDFVEAHQPSDGLAGGSGAGRNPLHDKSTCQLA